MPVLEREFRERLDHFNARVIHQHVEPAEPGADVLHDQLPVFLSRHVQMPEMRFMPCRPNVLDDCLARGIRATGDDHDRPGLGEHFRRPRPDPLPGPGHQRHFAFEITHVDSPF